MIIIKSKELSSYQGKYICCYGQPKVGKTVSTLATAPDPILWLTVEPRDFQLSIDAAKRPKLKFELAVYEDFIDLINFLNDPESFAKFTTVFFDGLSYLHNIVLPSEVQEEEYGALSDADKKKGKQIQSMTKVTLPQQGERNQGIFRILRLLGKNAVSKGKIVIVSCLEMERPKYDRELTAGPALSGREVPDNFPGFFDLIGRISPRLNKDEEVVYPPHISFEGAGEYLAGYTGSKGKKQGPMDWKKILGSIEGKVVERAKKEE